MRVRVNWAEGRPNSHVIPAKAGIQRGRENAPAIFKSNDFAAVKGTAHCADTPRYADSAAADS